MAKKKMPCKRYSANQLQNELVKERLRIWNDIFKASSVRPGERYAIISIGEKTLSDIVLPSLPSWYRKDRRSDDYNQLALPLHPSAAGAKPFGIPAPSNGNLPKGSSE